MPRLFREAIVRKICLAAVYNRTRIKLAPHIVYTKHDELFVDGVVVEREGKAPKEIKLGAFKLSGLTEVSLTVQSFAPNEVFDAANPKYEGTTVCVVKVGDA